MKKKRTTVPDKPVQNNYLKFVASLIATIRKFSLYPSKHPTVVYAIKNLYSSIQEILNIKSTVTISLSSDNLILIEGNSVGEKDSKLSGDLVGYLKELAIESLTFSLGVTDKELEQFLRILLFDQEEIKKIGDFNKIFLDKGIQHIKTAQFSYIKVQKGKTAVVVEKDKQQLLDELKVKVKDYSLDKIQGAEDIGRLESDIFDTVIAEFKEGEKLSGATKNMLKKFILKSGDKEGTLSRLKNALLNVNCLPEQADKLINKIKEEIFKKSRARITEIIQKETEKLRLENEELKLKNSQLQKEINLEVSTYERIKEENKRAVQEKERIDNIVHSMAEGLVVVDSAGNIVMLNPVAERLLCINKDSIGIPLNKAVKDEHLLTMVKNMKPDEDGTIQKDIELLSPDESTKRVLRTSSAVVEDHNGKTVGMVTVLNDITRQKEIEKMKSDFVASVSHELRTPLGTIQQNIALLLEGVPGGLNEDQLKFLNIAQDNMKRLRGLINDLLDSAAMEAGKFKLRLSKADINERVNNVVTFFNKWFEAKNMSIQISLFPENEILEMDKDRIEQVLTNLLSNAIKFTLEGGRIFVSTIKKEPTKEMPNGAIEISVCDTGPGIAPEDIERIFQKFERAGAANSNISGTGLGLSICKEIVRMHGGRIWVESRLNEGSKFSFLLPRKSSEKS